MTRPSASRGPPPLRRLEPSPPDVLVELHIYLVPKEKWLEQRRLAKNQVVDDAVSVGFVRVIPELSIHNLRREISLQLGPDVIPGDYVFLRSVGRNFTQVKPKQEHQLKAKNFVPPYAPEPEIYLLDVREPTNAPRLTDSPALRLAINRKSEPDESVLPVSSHTSLDHAHASLAPRPSSSSPSPSPPAAPGSEDSGIMASPTHILHQGIVVTNTPQLQADTSQDTSEDQADQTDMSPSAEQNNHKTKSRSQLNKKSTKKNKIKYRKSTPCKQGSPTTQFDSEFENEGGGEVSVTFVILEQDEREGGREGNSETESSKPREKILTEISDVLRQRRDAERRRHVLVEKATELQHRLRVRREKSQHALRDQLFAAKKSAMPIEESCATLRLELDAAHRQLLANIEGRELPLRIRDGPSKRANYKITAARLQHEIKDLQQKVNAVKLRLDSENKLKLQAERDVKQLRSELSQKKVSVSNLRSQMLGTLTMERSSRTPFFKTHNS